VTTTIHTAQFQLFGTDDVLPPGLRFAADLLDVHEEAALLAVAAALPLRSARYKEYTARRRVYAYGSRFDFDTYRLRPRAIGELPSPLAVLRGKLARWAEVQEADFVHVMVSEYTPGTPLGWHRDAPDYELIVGVSLGSAARLRLRPWPPTHDGQERIVALDLAPRIR
jgi:alkylated DNA repair dioxygenase AlkB